MELTGSGFALTSVSLHDLTLVIGLKRLVPHIVRDDILIFGHQFFPVARKFDLRRDKIIVEVAHRGTAGTREDTQPDAGTARNHDDEVFLSQGGILVLLMRFFDDVLFEFLFRPALTG